MHQIAQRCPPRRGRLRGQGTRECHACATLNSQDADKNKVEDAAWAALYDEEVRTYEEAGDVLLEKVKRVADYIRTSRHIVVYTGAGVSTSAQIPDYRGPEGVWTLTKKGISPNKSMLLSQALPTYTHYAITALVKRGLTVHPLLLCSYGQGLSITWSRRTSTVSIVAADYRRTTSPSYMETGTTQSETFSSHV